ncbi:uncharacterized protein B0T15DRAFT_16507 [Chaetomium strumarium]|uniref:SET domain-containing protein n=1 Tax=Chaetomium strumarium TaxID=1170767 RepID=A0AAJ0H1L4_9PEZI|nr:hypothetical protein B0T15DRAFT_16507 [Chaetomium strumarium]
MAATKDAVAAVPASRPSKEKLVKTHQAHLKKQASSPNAPRPVKQPILSDAYPPSTKSIRELEIIPLCELGAETHHRGKGIIVRVISAPFVGAGAVSIVEDEFGNADKLAIYNQPDSSILSGAPEGCVVAVKEPYYKNNGAEDDFMICVDHPSDVILLRFTDPIIPEALRLGPLLKTAEEWKIAGDRAFIEKDFPTAVFCYTEALEASEDPAFQAPIYTKRAGTNLILGRYDAAKADALASRTGGPQDWKAYYNAGRAAYGLCDYGESNTYLSAALKLNPSNASIQREHARCQARLREEANGDETEYDFAGLLASLVVVAGPQSQSQSQSQTTAVAVHLDRGSFLRKNTRVAESAHHGRGLFAARDMKAGELVFVEKATLMPNQYDPARASAALYALMVRQLCDNPSSLSGPVLDLYAGGGAGGGDDRYYERSGKEGTIVDGVPVVDVFLVERIRTTNCFSAPRATVLDTAPSAPEGQQAKGLWLHASRMNHSCVPNTMRSFLGDLLISRATRDITEGEELFQQYIPVKPLPDVRNEKFKEGWGFECDCVLCVGERRSPEAMLAKRKEVLAAVEKLCNKKLPRRELIPEATIRNVDRLMKQLEDAHEPEVYDGLPRLTLIYPCNWLVAAHRGRKNYAKVVKYALKVLRNFGFRVPDDGSAVWDPRDMYTKSGNASLMTVHVVAALRNLAEAYKALGYDEMAGKCIEAAEFGYLMVTGFQNDLATLDK